jgi:UDP-glucose 4-epimerase
LYQELYGLDFTSLALANVYGPRQDPHGEAGVVAIFARNLVAGLASTIHGEGTQTRDFVHVEDVVEAFIRATQSGGGSLFNIGSGVQTSVNELYDAMAAHVDGAMSPVHGPARTGDIEASALDSQRAQKVLGWAPRRFLADGVLSVLDYEQGKLSPRQT